MTSTAIKAPLSAFKDKDISWIIQLWYLEFDPLTYQKCQRKINVIRFIENKEFIKKIFKQLGLREVNLLEVWWVKTRSAPKAKILPKCESFINYSRPGCRPQGPMLTPRSAHPISGTMWTPSIWGFIPPDFFTVVNMGIPFKVIPNICNISSYL